MLMSCYVCVRAVVGVDTAVTDVIDCLCFDGKIAEDIPCLSYEEGASSTVDRVITEDTCCVADTGPDSALIMSLYGAVVTDRITVDGFDSLSSC